MEELRSLVVRAQSGDLEAYGKIAHRFQDMAYGYAYAILGDFQLAEDAAQEAFIEAYRCLCGLDDPAAFAGWFRTVVQRRCNRLARRKRVPTVPLESARAVPSDRPGPAESAEKREIVDKVLEAVRSLPEDERSATTLFYINGYSYRDIAEFLEVPVTTVKNRLRASRKELKERMVAMLDETLKANAPGESFSRKVIDELLARPRPLEIEGHPVRQVWELIQAALPDYEVIAALEVEKRGTLRSELEDAYPAYHMHNDRILRTHTTTATMKAMRGRTAPARLLAAGRCFRPDKEDQHHQKVFHQVDALCVEEGAGTHMLEQALAKVVNAVLGVVELRCQEYGYDFVDEGQDVYAKLEGRWLEVAGCGLLKEETLRESGYDPEAVAGFAFGLGLERLAMLKYGIDDIRKLWQPPYVPE